MNKLLFKLKLMKTKCPECNSKKYDIRHYHYKIYGICDKCKNKFRIY